MKTRWLFPPENLDLVRQLTRGLAIRPLTAQCLVNRGITNPSEATAFLEPRLKLLSDPLRLPQLSLAIDRLLLAREKEESLVIFGDYDVDGVTSTALLELVLSTLGWNVSHYLPRRQGEGYGLTRPALESCLSRASVDVLLAVDCGSTSNDLIDWLQDQDVTVIVLDHHQLSSPPPRPFALVNPQMDTSPEPHGRELCSVGIVFKLLHGLVRQGRELGLPGFANLDLKESLDLVALGTIADMVPLTGENRILVHAGLKRLETTTLPGLVALKNVAQTRSPVGSYEVGFQLAPRLNSAGRLETAEAAIELLMARDELSARTLADALNETNRERQEIERKMADSALDMVRKKLDLEQDFVVVEGNSNWHLGILGIVASRVLREFHRPTFILGRDADGWRGSGRSIPGFDLAAALRECGDLLTRHGGHAMAAGVSLPLEHLDLFRTRLNALARSWVKPAQLEPEIRLDGQAQLSELSLEQVSELFRLAPFGSHNPAVQFLIPSVFMGRPPQRLGRELRHWKLWLTQGGRPVETLWWGAGQETLPTGVFDVAVAPQLDNFAGTTTVKLRLLDWRPAGLATS